jgi:hypothetical protein
MDRIKFASYPESMKKSNFDRRSFLKTMGGVGLGMIASYLGKTSQAFAETCDKLNPKHQMASLLAYVPLSKTKGQNCKNCIQYKQIEKSENGSCAIFQGCEVAAKGWCKSWSKKA